MSSSPISTVVEVQQAERTLAPTQGLARARRRLGPARTWALVSLSLDAAMLVAASAAAEIGAGAAGVSALNVFWDTAFGLVAVGFLASRGLYRLGLWTKPLDDLGRVTMAVGLAAMSVVSLRVLFFGDATSAPAALREAAFAVVYVGAGRVALYWSVSNAYARGDLVRPTLIVGAGRVGRVVARRLLSHPQLGLKPIAFLDDEPLVGEGEELELPLAGTMQEIEWAIAENRVKHVVVTFSRASDEELLEIVNRCERLGVGVSVVPRLFEKVPERVDVDHLGGLPLVTARPTSPKGWQFAIKYAIDRVLAAIAIVCLLPILAAAAAAVWLSMGRPIFFRQPRVGLDGNVFDMLKFRSMRGTPEQGGEADAAWLKQQVGQLEAAAAVQTADRRTRVGTILRKTSIDELAQLFNVLKGEMSMVGPRPERVAYVQEFDRSVYRYGDRHRCKSGITGWAQVHGLRGKTSIADRAEWDNYYIENFSLWLDLRIALMTLAAVVGAFRDVE
jgi:exopolysaccharide biosynthesis polyprenyl glycosylphosphotransferase